MRLAARSDGRVHWKLASCVASGAAPHGLRRQNAALATQSVLTCAPRLPSYTGEYNGGSMSGLGVYKWANGRHVVRVRYPAACADSASLHRSIYKGEWKARLAANVSSHK